MARSPEMKVEAPIDEKTSLRIEILRFPLIVGVVFIHNYVTTVPMAQGSMGVTHCSAWVDYIRFFISRGIAQVAIPLFFLISGYLFFQGQWTWGRYAGRLKRRISSLLIPFLFWSLATLAVFAAVQALPQTKGYFAGSVWPPVYSFSPFDYLNAVFGLTVKFPIAFQFWFIRDLMALVLLAPAIHYLLARKSALPFLFVLFGLWYFMAWPLLWPNVDSVFFFSMGAYLSRPGRSLSSLDSFGPWLGAGFVLLLVVYAIFPAGIPLLQRDVIILGVPSLWWLTGIAARKSYLKSWLLELSGSSFFIFAAHEPLLMMLRKVTYRLLSPTGSATILALYFLNAICLIGFLVAVHSCLMKISPGFTRMITGKPLRDDRCRLEAAVAPEAASSARDSDCRRTADALDGQ